jgi:hypothetical protein
LEGTTDIPVLGVQRKGEEEGKEQVDLAEQHGVRAVRA